MSINITVHSRSQPGSRNDADPFASLESVRKAENERLRRVRLEQVREQSKQVAARVRKNFQTAKQKELQNVQRIRQQELKSWKQKHIAQLQEDYRHCLEDVGEAHRAAEAADQCEVWFQEKKATQQAAALQRGKQAGVKLAQDIQDREDKKAKKRKEYKPSKSVGVQVCPVEEKAVQMDISSSSGNTLSAFEQFKKSSKAKSLPEVQSQQDRPLSPDFISSDEELLPYLPKGKDKENIPSHSNNTLSKPVDTLYYNPTSFTSPDTLNIVNTGPPAHTTKHPPPKLEPFTQVSDFIKRRREERSQPKYVPASYSSQKNVQFDDHSENTLSFPTTAALDRSILESPRKPVRKQVELPAPAKAKDSAASSSKSTTTGAAAAPPSKVQYYDYGTKYRKEYDQPAALVQRHEMRQGELNAMQEASRLERLQSDMLNARKQPPAEQDRSKVALEKLQMRKDYENLKADLDKLVRAESQIRGRDTSKKPLLTETRQRQRSETRQKRMNEAVEDLIKQRVLITCPVVREPPAKGGPVQQLANRPSQVNVASGVGRRAAAGDDFVLRDVNSSDSCSTIMLGYEPTGEGAVRAGIPLPGQKETDKVTQLKELLEQINEQKKLLVEELKKEEEIEEELRVPVVNLKSTKSQTDNGINKLLRRQEELEEQQKKLHEKEKEIRDLEKQLKEKLKRLEKEKSKPKVPIHVETNGSGTADVKMLHDTSSTGSIDSVQSGSEIPVKIVITVNDKSQKKVKKTPKKVVPEVRKRKKAKDVVDKAVEQQLEVVTKPPQKVKEIVEKPVPILKKTQDQEQSPISSTTSTIYRGLPDKIDNRVGRLLQHMAELPLPQPEPPSTKPQRVKSVPKHQLKKTTPPAPPPIEQPLPHPQAFNPNLMQYIIRLLGMSRHSIEQLGVSSSTTVSTPRDSVVNVSGNQSSVDEQHPVVQDQSRLDKLRRFIDENYNFLNEIDETLKDQELNGTTDENISRVEDVWMRTLSRKEREIRREKPKPTPPPKVPIQQSPPVKDTSLRSILKSPKKAPAKVAQIITPQGHVEVINLSDRDEQEVLQKYSQLTDSCSKRISELSDMIQKVREEKKKLIEHSLSSASEQPESTKYMDLPRLSGSLTQPQPKPTAGGGVVLEASPQSGKDDPVSEEINNIFATHSRQIGLSKDSGIAMSRPVTSSDFRDSPDARPPNAGAPQFESSEDLSGRDGVVAVVPPVTTFEPLLKDIPKNNVRLPITDIPPHAPPVRPPPVQEAKEPSIAKRTKPPVAITRYSPQLDEATAAHELSTIPEVETPLASKANISIPPGGEKLVVDPAEQLLVEARDKLLEHARALGYEHFPEYEEYLRRENLDATRYDPEKTSTARLNELLEVTDKSDLLRYQKFPLPAPEMNITEETMKGSDGGKKSGLESNSSSSTSLPDVVAELKLRNIIDKSFDNSLDDSNRSTPDSASVEIIRPVPIQGKSPTKKKHSKKPDTAQNPEHSNSEPSASLERDLNELGLRWASSMLKKNQQALLQDHSSSSSLSTVDDIRRASFKKPYPPPPAVPSIPGDPNDDSQQPPSGKPLNLREFIARELMIRTHSDLNSLSDSSSPCSLLLKSLLDISHINTSTPELLTQTTDKNIQRTSTPVATKSSISTPRENAGATKDDGSLNGTNGLFSGESKLSSVHMSSSSSASGSGENKLTVPNVRLNVDKYQSKGDEVSKKK